MEAVRSAGARPIGRDLVENCPNESSMNVSRRVAEHICPRPELSALPYTSAGDCR